MNQVSPSRTLVIGGKKHVLDGSFATLRAVQEHFGRDIVAVLAGVLEMRLDQVVDLIAIGAGEKRDGIGQAVVDTMDVMDFRLGSDYQLLKVDLLAWLNIAIAPKAEREKKSGEMQALIDGLKNPPSPGPTTSASPSESSAGSPPSSGVVTSGS